MTFKVEQVNSPLIKGETYLVPCFVKTGDGMTSITTGFDSEEKTYITPVRKRGGGKDNVSATRAAI